MNNGSPEERNVMQLWQNQKTEGVRMSVEQVRMEAGRFGRRIGARNLREYVSALAVILFFAWNFARTHEALPRVGSGLLIAGVGYVVWHLLTRGSPGTIGDNAGWSTWIEFRRAELVRQRDLLRSIWRWYLGPVIPGTIVLFIGAIRVAHLSTHSLILWTIDAVVVVAIFLAIAQLNKRGARKLQDQIDELDRQTRD